MKLKTAFAATLILTATSLAEDVSIERIAPKETIFILGVTDYSQAMERWDRTTLPQLMKLEAMQASEDDAVARAPLPEAYRTMIKGIFEELGIDEEPAQAMPTGAMGLAMFTHVDVEKTRRRPAMIALADYGANAEVMQKLLDRVREEADQTDEIEYEVEEVLGRTVYSFTMPEFDTDVLDDALDQFSPGAGLPPMVPMPDFGDIFGEMKHIHLARDGSVFYLTSEMDQLAETFSLIDAGGASEFMDRDDAQGVRSQIGAADAYGMLFLQPMFKMMSEVDPSAAMLPATFQMIVGDVKAFGFGMRLDGDTAMVEATMTMYMPGGKSGLTMLIDRPGPRGELPGFVGPNVVSFATFNVDMSGVGQFVKSFVQGNPMLQAQVGQMMPQIQVMLDSISAALGDRIYVMTTQQQPITLESVGTLTAITCNDPKGFETAIAEFVPQMGMQPRDFLGHRIYSMDPGMAQMMGMPGGGPAIGIGAGYVFLGTDLPVQQALRSAGQSDVPTLAGEPDFRSAVAGLAADDVIGWGFVETVNSLEGSMVVSRLQQQQMIKDIRQWDPEMADEMADEMVDPLKNWDEQSLEELRELIGPLAWQVRSTDFGFVMSFNQHRGAGETVDE